jgi:prevent-host-death family protein
MDKSLQLPLGTRPWIRSKKLAPGDALRTGATLSHMEIGVRDLRNRTGQVIDAVQAGERVTLTVHGEPVADIVPHGRRARWLSGEHLREQLRHRAADPELTRDLNELAGQTLDEL